MLSTGKHFCSQKLIELTVEEAADMINAAKTAGVKFAASPMLIHKFSYRCVHYVNESNADAVITIAKPIMTSGVKGKDALHVACAIHASCDYFLTTTHRPRESRCQLYFLPTEK